jgi:hypothetical protein
MQGRKKIIQTPEMFWELFIDYKTWAKQNPIKVHDYVGKDALEVHRNRERPLTIEGFENYVDNKGIITDLGNYFENKEKRYSDFVAICSRVKREIREDQIIGGMVGIYNPSITQRLNALTEKTEKT